MAERFYSFKRYLQDNFGERVQRISLDAGFNCPNLDGTLSREGCTYCNNKAFARYAQSGVSLKKQIEESMAFYQQRLGVKKFIAYFQSFTNTHAALPALAEKYRVIKHYPQIVGLFISTRPDAVDAQKLKLIAEYKRDYLVWIEYGLQTTHNRILRSINRNHTYEDFLQALALTREYGINVGVHLILGLPSANGEDIREDARKIAGLDVQGVKFHVLHVLKDTRLEGLYRQRKVRILDPQDYVNIICDFLERVPPNLVVLRLVPGAFPDYLVEPWWINDKHRVLDGIRKEFERRGTYQGSGYQR